MKTKEVLKISKFWRYTGDGWDWSIII